MEFRGFWEILKATSITTNPPSRWCIVLSKCVLSCFRLVRLFVTLWTSLPGSSVHGFLQGRVLEWVAMPCLTQGSNLHLMFPALAGGFFTTSATWEACIASN